MRIKKGREWVEMGPGRAVTTSAGQASVAGYNVGHMKPDPNLNQAMPRRVAPELRSPNPLGIRSLG